MGICHGNIIWVNNKNSWDIIAKTNVIIFHNQLPFFWQFRWVK